METYIAKLKGNKLHLYRGNVEIGLISPDATWVKEGDEFDEDEVEEWQYTEKGWYLPLFLSSVRGLAIRYKIKGPCGHFH